MGRLSLAALVLPASGCGQAAEPRRGPAVIADGDRPNVAGYRRLARLVPRP